MSFLPINAFPLGANLEGKFDSDESGWKASFTPFGIKPNTPPGVLFLERVELEVWWVGGRQAVQLSRGRI